VRHKNAAVYQKEVMAGGVWLKQRLAKTATANSALAYIP